MVVDGGGSPSEISELEVKGRGTRPRRRQRSRAKHDVLAVDCLCRACCAIILCFSCEQIPGVLNDEAAVSWMLRYDENIRVN